MIEIIPAIDILDGKCVRLSKGDYTQKKVYSDNPLDVAKAFEDAGCKRLHLVDLDGAKSSHIVNYKTLESIASGSNLTIDFGGGIKSDNDVKIAFDNGASMITGGSVALKNPELFESWLTTFGSNKIILGADAKNRMIAASGWLEESDAEIIPFITNYVSMGVVNVISTDIDCDGMLQGPSLELYKDILHNIPNLFLIASGGVSNIADIVALNGINVHAVIVGKAIYEGRISMKELENLNLQSLC